MPNHPGGRDELSVTLRALRRDAELSTRGTAERTGFSAAKVSRIERGIGVPTESDVEKLAHAYRAPAETRRRLLAISRDMRSERLPVVMARSKGHPSVFQNRLNRIEATTAHLTTFTPTIVPGLLQTPTYMRWLLAYRALPEAEVEAFVAARLARQDRLNDVSRDFTLVTTVGALGWRAGSNWDMVVQLDRIIAVSRYPTVRVGVIPWGTQAEVFPLHGWDLHDQRAVIYGTVDATAILTSPPDVTRYAELTEAVTGLAVFGDGARRVLEDVRQDYLRMG